MASLMSGLLEEAVESISSLPGVGRRSATRLALYLLRQPVENVKHFTSSIDRMRTDVRYCSVCNMISDTPVCPICSGTSRNHNIICVVESITDVMSIEQTGEYNGVYHVLGGIISPINGVGPSDLAICQLVKRLSEYPSNVQVEVIMALSGDVEGETTAFYLYRQISGFNVKVTTLARGLGFADDLEYADTVTLGRSIAARQLFKV